MDSLSVWLRLYCLLNFAVEFNSYVLLAANADDFRNIAKQIVPENLAEKLALLASDTSIKQNTRDNGQKTDYYYESEAEDDDADTREDSATKNNVRDLNDSEEATYVKEWKTKVNFDELVEKVKDRLAKELNEKIKKHILNTETKSPYENIHNNFKQKEVQNERLKYSTKNDVDYGYNYNQNNVKAEKTYDDNNYKNKYRPKNHQKSINNSDNTNYQGLKQKKNLLKNIELEHESFENNKHIYHEEKTRERYDGRVTANYKTTNDYLNSKSKEKNHISKEKQSNEMNHEEDNNLFHSKNKPLKYGVHEMPEKISNIEFNKKYINDNDDSIKYTEKDTLENKYQENEPVEHNYDDSLSKQYKSDQNVFVVTNNNKQALYEEFDLLSKRRNDSYEDYEVPKAENKYASDEINTPVSKGLSRNIKKNLLNNNDKSRFKVQYNDHVQSLRPIINGWQHIKTIKSKYTEDYSEVTEKSQEVKAKTESLWYNYEDIGPKSVKDDRSKDIEMISKAPTRKAKAKGTMIPTREYFKMSSPNYYISLPTVVEKYDSNEPLPERDREREVIKHFVNPPASINKKFRLI